MPSSDADSIAAVSDGIPLVEYMAKEGVRNVYLCRSLYTNTLDHRTRNHINLSLLEAVGVRVLLCHNSWCIMLRKYVIVPATAWLLQI